MSPRAYWLSHLAVLPFLLASACFAGPTYTDAEEVDEDYAYQGDYQGSDVSPDGEESTIGVQLVAEGEGNYSGALYLGGLPGESEDFLGIPLDSLTREGNTLTRADGQGSLVLEGNTLRALDAEGNEMGKVERITRESPTLGAEPPEGAIVLFDGTNLDHWQEGARMTDDGLLMEGLTSTDTFQSHQLHLEFMLPYMPEDSGQSRGNSGCYLQGRYEVQILDSFGLEGLNNECGGIYELKAPDFNMCYPPLTWQTYDIDFTAAQYDEAGELAANPRVTVRHNGEVIHDDVELPAPTRAAPVAAGPEPGPVFLQDHGNPVRFRNIWVQPAEED